MNLLGTLGTTTILSLLQDIKASISAPVLTSYSPILLLFKISAVIKPSHFIGSLKVILISSPDDKIPSAGSGVPKISGAKRSILPEITVELPGFRPPIHCVIALISYSPSFSPVVPHLTILKTSLSSSDLSIWAIFIHAPSPCFLRY